MLKFTSLFGLVLLTVSSAFAFCGDDGNLDDWTCPFLTVTAVTSLLPYAAGEPSSQNRIAYVNVVRDDAAEFVAAGGAEAASAALQDVIDQVREKDVNARQMSDLAIAKLVATDFN